jgi:cell division protein FtsQ
MTRRPRRRRPAPGRTVRRPRTTAPAAPSREAAARPRRKRMVIGTAIVVTALSSICLAGYVLAARWEAFRLGRVEHPGLSRAEAAALIEQAGLNRSVSLLALRLDKIARQIRRDPWVKSVELARRLPDTLVIQVTRYRPVAILRFAGLHYLDASGVPFKGVESGDRLDLPTITLAPEALAVSVLEAEEGVRRSLTLLEALRAHGGLFAGRNVSEIVFDPHLGFTVILARGPAWIRFGFFDLKTQLRRLARVWRNLGSAQRTGCLIDLDYPDRAVVRIVGQRGRP